ncbi:sigma-54-dependent Fis family transcriptional regulator [Pedobacter sp.]|uniref:sigma-54-dependent Fis family transcriptional regulator n=1 Tax=Pedobacter sp. TaxID=1411316 RepID=UPI003C451906
MEDKNEISKKVETIQMDSAGELEFLKKYHLASPLEKNFYQDILDTLEGLQRERYYILELGKDITKVREKDDLIKIFSKRIKEFFYFNHSIISVIDKNEKSYSPFLLNPAASPLVQHKEYNNLVASHFTLDEPFIQQVLASDGPVLFELEKIMDRAGSPLFLRANYEVGLRKILMTPLRSKSRTIGFLHMYSDRDDTFSEEFISIINGIAPQLSNSVTNIMMNEKNHRSVEIDNALLDLGHDLVQIKDKRQLLDILNSSLKQFIDFSHSLLTTSGDSFKSYNILLTDSDYSQLFDYAELRLLQSNTSLEDDIYDVASLSYYPVVFDLDVPLKKSPPYWFTDAARRGCKEVMVKILPNGDIKKFGLVLLSDKKGAFNEEAIEIIETISGQLSSIIGNLLTTEAIISKEREKTILLDFSSDIATVRTKEDLEQVISQVLQRLLHTKLTVIRLLKDDAYRLEPYMYDKGAAILADPLCLELLRKEMNVEEEIWRQLLASEEPVLFNIEHEIDRALDPGLVKFWKQNGVKRACGSALRVGNVDLGVLLLLTEETNIAILKGISAQISIAVFNIQTHQRLIDYKNQLEEENVHLHEQINTLLNFSEIVGNGSNMQEVYKKMEIVAPANSTVIILGETGTGKELIARAIHNSSPRKSKNMVKVNCAALPAHLIESELFGHEKGAFTGATERRIGKFELAHEGTIFLDEIGELPLDLQVKLLRVLQEREFERLGGSNTVKVDVRVVAATNRDLQLEVSAGRFRSDLFYRLNVFPISLPPLRERQEDIPALAHYFLERFSKRVGLRLNTISPSVMDKLLNYKWPGNIRELEHLIERSVLLNRGTVLTNVHLPGLSEETDMDMQELLPSKTLEEMERLHIINILKKCNGKISGKGGAADLLEIPASTLHSKMKKLNITRADYQLDQPG